MARHMQTLPGDKAEPTEYKYRRKGDVPQEAERVIVRVKDFAASPKVRNAAVNESDAPIRVVELFAGVGGFRIGLERASNRSETVWNGFAVAS